MKKKSFAEAECPIARALDVVGDWWSLQIVRDALRGVRRFTDFAQGLGVAKNILADRLKRLVGAGILQVVPASDGSAYNEYVLTAKGRDLWVLLVALRQWSDRWIPGANEYGQVLVDAQNGEPVAPLELHASDGRKLDLTDLRLVASASTRAKSA